MSPGGGDFVVLRREGEPGELVTTAPDPARRRRVHLVHPSSAAVVLGSTQAEDSIDTAAVTAAGYALVRRRSGGGAVPVAPGAQAWVDLYLPRGDPLFVDDVGESARWVGECWRAALATLVGAEGLRVYDGPLVSTRWSRRWCFSGHGPGEVDLDGRKVLGIAQRRDRAGAWFFTMVLTRTDPETEAGFLSLEATERAAFSADLAAGVGAVAWDVARLEEAFLEALGDLTSP